MTKDGFMFLVMGFKGAKAERIKEAYINAFNAMADELAGKPPRPALPAKIEPRSFFDLDYVRDYRDDDSRPVDVGWWEFERVGAGAAWRRRWTMRRAMPSSVRPSSSHSTRAMTRSRPSPGA